MPERLRCKDAIHYVCKSGVGAAYVAVSIVSHVSDVSVVGGQFSWVCETVGTFVTQEWDVEMVGTFVTGHG